MARVWGLIFGVFLAASFVCVPSLAFAATYFPTEADAFTACEAVVSNYQATHPNDQYASEVKCVYSGESGNGGIPQCASGLGSSAWYVALHPMAGQIGGSFSWCYPSQCSAGGDGGTYANDASYSVNKKTDGRGCCADYVQDRTISYAGSTWNAGNVVDSGGYCDEAYGSAGSLTGPDDPGAPKDAPPKICDSGHASCYDPKNHQACYGTESGESVCIGVGDNSSPGGCATGATGSVCVGHPGSPAPQPSDPPIADGQPPQVTASGSDSSGGGGGGGSPVDWTTLGYSGTSPGPGPSSSATPADQGGGTGSQSNNNGAGNSGKNGTDDSGKCPSGAVPTASGCSGTYTDGGCDTPPQCYGDAVLCGIAREDHYTRCATQKMAAASGSSSGGYGDVGDALAGAGVPADGGASGDPSTSGLVSSSDIGEDGFDAAGLGFSRTCPANPTFSVLGHSYTFDLAPFCNFAGMLGWFVLLVAYLSGMRIVATGKA